MEESSPQCLLFTLGRLSEEWRDRASVHVDSYGLQLDLQIQSHNFKFEVYFSTGVEKMTQVSLGSNPFEINQLINSSVCAR